jgi:hypothetical protein
MNNEVNVNFINEYCPKCKSRLLTNWEHKWCSFLGAGPNYPRCDYGHTEPVRYEPTESK